MSGPEIDAGVYFRYAVTGHAAFITRSDAIEHLRTRAGGVGVTVTRALDDLQFYE